MNTLSLSNVHSPVLLGPKRSFQTEHKSDFIFCSFYPLEGIKAGRSHYIFQIISISQNLILRGKNIFIWKSIYANNLSLKVWWLRHRTI